MNTRNRLRKSAALWFAVLMAASSTGAGADVGNPNIHFIFTDDQPQICMSCMGNEHIRTPNMDRLASQGVLFTNASATTAYCNRSRF